MEHPEPQSLYDFSRRISDLNKAKKYNDVLSYFKSYKKEFRDDDIASNAYLIAAMITALRHTGHIDAAFKFLDLYKINIGEGTGEKILCAYGWLLYSSLKDEHDIQDNDEEINLFEEDEMIETSDDDFTKSELLERVEKFLPLILKIKNDYAYNVFSFLFNQVLKTEKSKLKPNWRFISEFCDLVNPELMSDACRTIEVTRKGEKKQMELASDKENWYAYKSKALFMLGSFDECYEVSKKALDSFEKFHYSNDVWFARRIALSKKKLGKTDEAIKDLEIILKRKREWFIQKELAELYKEAGDTDKSLKLAIAAVTNYGELKYKVELLSLIGELLKIKSQDELAFKHFTLSKLIRLKEGWSVNPNLDSAISHFNLPEIPSDSLPSLLQDLKKYWNSENIRGNVGLAKPVRLKGRIDKILHNNEKGADGFIKYDVNKSVYFRLKPDDPLVSKISEGSDVSFKYFPADGSKKDIAIQLKMCSD